MTISLRPYQVESVSALWSWFDAGNEGNPLVIAPVGSGKSLLMAAFIREALAAFADTRVLVVTNSRELVRQDYEKMLAVWPQAPAGIYAAGLRRREIGAQVLFGSIQSLFRKSFNVQKCDLLLVDEAHTIGRKDQAMWGRFLRELREINGRHMRVIGYTATAWRQDTGSLLDGADALFSDVAHEIKMLDLINQGYLAPLVSRPRPVQIDLTGVGVRGGDYIPGQLEAAADSVTEAAVADLVEAGRDRRCWLTFCAGLQHAFHVRDVIRSYGITCETVTGETPADERDQILRDLEAGRIRAVTNYACLTTGVDVPPIDLLAMMRPTRSSGLVVQMAGRGTRLSPATGKVDCLFLDYASVLRQHGTIDTIEAPRRRKGDGCGEAPSKTCPECETKVPAGALECGVCGFAFPINTAPKIEATAATTAVLSSQIQPEWVDVTAINYRRHEKPGGTPSLRVDYVCGLTRHSAWWCPEHSGFARQKFVQTWQRHAPGVRVPNSVDEALEQSHALAKPKRIQVRPSGKFSEIVGVAFA